MTNNLLVRETNEKLTITKFSGFDNNSKHISGNCEIHKKVILEEMPLEALSMGLGMSIYLPRIRRETKRVLVKKDGTPVNLEDMKVITYH